MESEVGGMWYRCAAEGGGSLVIIALLFVISMAGFAQFAIYYWRACIATTLGEPVSPQVRNAAGISGSVIGSHDFRTITKLHDSISGKSQRGRKLRAIRAYYWFVEKLGSIVPAAGNWAETEMAMCSHYMAVQVDRLLARDMSLDSDGKVM